MKKLVYSLLATIAICSTASAQIWNWSASGNPYNPAGNGTAAIFSDNDGGSWAFSTLTIGNTNAASWTVLPGPINNPTENYFTVDFAVLSVATVPFNASAFILLQNASATNSFALTFTAPTTGFYSISGAASISSPNGDANSVNVGRINGISGPMPGTFQSLQNVTGGGAFDNMTNTFALQPAFSTFSALQNISLSAGDTLAFILPRSDNNTTATWQLFGNSANQPNVQANTLTITAVPEPSTVLLLGLGSAFTLWNVRRRRAIQA